MDVSYLKISVKLLNLRPQLLLSTREIARPLGISTTTIIKRFARYGLKPEIMKEGCATRCFKWKTDEVLLAAKRDLDGVM